MMMHYKGLKLCLPVWNDALQSRGVRRAHNLYVQLYARHHSNKYIELEQKSSCHLKNATFDSIHSVTG